MDKAFNNVIAMAKQHNVNMRTAAYMLAVRRVADTMGARKGKPTALLLKPSLPKA